ncbi:MAG: sulfite exporter TauE/SafE family protein, partial [Deltaproteobacteria bacterium]|nr:sulfite exporter TauE/SafE family protein [Deltaproteobacteria bacterium]
AGTLPGVFIGAIVRVKFLPDPKAFKLFAACVMLCTGVKMVRGLLKNQARLTQKNDIDHRFQEGMSPYCKRCVKQDRPGNDPLFTVNVTHFNLKRLEYEFYGGRFDVSFWGIFALSFIVGIVGGIYGIGGGAVIAPFFVTVFNLPIYTVAGAALMGTFVTSLGAVVFYQIIAPIYPDISIAPDWFLGFLFGLGGIAGMYLGARCQKFVPAKAIKWMLAGVIVFTGIKYLAAFFSD